MKYILKAGVVAVAAVLTLAACGDKIPASEVLVKVDGVAIGKDTLEWILKEQVPAGTPVDEALRKQAREHLIQRQTLLAAARSAKLDEQADVKMRMDFVRDEQLVNAYIKDWIAKHPVSDEQVKAEYDKRVADPANTEYKARHILVEKEEDAKALIEKLQKGASFPALAKSSKDPGSAANGGDLGWARGGTYVPEFANALKTLEKGKFSTEPVKSQFGYHVILLEDSRQAQLPPLESVKTQLQQAMQQEAVGTYLKELVAKAKIEEGKSESAEPKAAASK